MFRFLVTGFRTQEQAELFAEFVQWATKEYFLDMSLEHDPPFKAELLPCTSTHMLVGLTEDNGAELWSE